MSSTVKPKFIEYDSQTEEQNLVSLFEEKTGRTLYPAQDERLMISIIEYKASLLVNMFNEAAKLNLTQYSKGAILDCIGEMFDTKRLQGEYGYDTLKITLNTTFTNDLTISKGLEVMSKDEKFTFATSEDLIIPAGETEGSVKVVAKEIGADVNVYGASDVNILVKPVSYIDSVTNLNGISGGAGVETDEAYIKRILLAPERFSCAGSRQSYIYHALSANAKIIDASAESVQYKANITISTTQNDETTTTTYEESSGQITTPDFTASVNHKLGKFEFTLNNKTYSLNMLPDTTVKIYPLTDEETTPQAVLDDVETLLNGDSVNPMTDNVLAISPTKVTKTIAVTIKLDEEADSDYVSAQANEILNEYKSTMRSKLGSEIVPSQLISKLGIIEGVYSVTTDLAGIFSTDLSEYIDITFNLTINS